MSINPGLVIYVITTHHFRIQTLIISQSLCVNDIYPHSVSYVGPTVIIETVTTNPNAPHPNPPPPSATPYRTAPLGTEKRSAVLI